MSKSLTRAVTPLLLVGCCRLSLAADTDNDLQLREGDRVVLLGSTIIEREQQFGHWETLLTIAFANKNITFRNLGWSGDTVWGESRGLFEPHLGYQRLIEHVSAANPTVVLVAYGSNEAFDGEQRLDEFISQYGKMLDALVAEGRRFVLLGPLHMEATQLPHDPDAAADFVEQYNRDVDRYAEAIAALAADRGHGHIDMRPEQANSFDQGGTPLTLNGLTLTDAGYLQTARWLATDLAPASDVNDLDVTTPAIQRLRETIVHKNELFFHRWRPQNFTYLYSFRKHEQGNNAVEIPQFDPLIEQAEQEIARLAQEVD